MSSKCNYIKEITQDNAAWGNYLLNNVKSVQRTISPFHAKQDISYSFISFYSG